MGQRRERHKPNNVRIAGICVQIWERPSSVSSSVRIRNFQSLSLQKQPSPQKRELRRLYLRTPRLQHNRVEHRPGTSRKWKLYQRVEELHAEGMSLRKIGEELGLARNTVRKYFRKSPQPPSPTPRAFRASLLDPYDDYLLERLKPGMPERSSTFS